MAKKYKYRHKENYKGTTIDIKADSLNVLMEKLQQRRERIDRQIIDPNMPFRTFAEKYLETYKENQVSASWYRDIKRFTLNKIVPSIGNKPVGKIKPIEVQEFLNSLTSYSNSYIKKICELTCQLFRCAYKNGMTPTGLYARF